MTMDNQPIAYDLFDKDEYIVNIGPQHPSTHGVLRLITSLKGENVQKIIFGVFKKMFEGCAGTIDNYGPVTKEIIEATKDVYF